MQYCHHLITALLQKLLLVGGFVIFFAPFMFAQSPSSLSSESSPSSLGSSPSSLGSSPASPPWQQLLSELSEMEDFENTAWEDYEEDLEELSQHPMNLNAASREDLERLPFLTTSQVEDILYYN